MVSAKTTLRLAVVVLLSAGFVRADEPYPLSVLRGPHRSAPAPVLPAVVSDLPPHAASEPPLTDLTPPGFTDLIPPDEHKSHDHVPGHLEPLVPHGRGFFLNADYLLVRPRVDGLDYAVRNRDFGLATVGRVAELRSRLGNGFRVELGYRLPGAGLDVSVGYGFVRAFGDATIGADGGALFPTQTRPGLIDTVTSATARYDLNHNVFDALVGKRWALDEHLAVRGFGGVRFADIRQNFDMGYDGLDARTAQVLVRSRFQGAGPVVGGEAVYAGKRGFHLYARGSGGLISGLDEGSRVETNDAGRTLYADTPLSVRKVVPTVGLGVGGGFQYRSFSFRAGYEATHWFGVADHVRFSSDVAPGALAPHSGNLSLDGLFLQLGLTF